jgi:AraC family transcriptional regulator
VQRLGSGEDFASHSAAKTFGDVTLVRCSYRSAALTPRHLHAQPYFGLILGGHFREDYNSHAIEAGRGQVAFHPADSSHTTNLAPGIDILRVELGAQFTSRECARMLERNASVVSGVRGAVLSRLVDEFEEPDCVTPLVVEGMALELIASLVRSQNDARTPPRWLARVRELLRDELGRPHSLAALAREAGVYPSHVARAFRSHYGTTVGEFVREERITFARKLLETTSIPVIEIALSAGFGSQSHFSNAFRRATGHSPVAYRRARQARDIDVDGVQDGI